MIRKKNLGKGLGKLSFRKKVSVSEKSLGFVQNFRQTAGNQMEAKKTSRDLLALVGDTKTNTLIHKQKMKKANIFFKKKKGDRRRAGGFGGEDLVCDGLSCRTGDGRREGE